MPIDRPNDKPMYKEKGGGNKNDLFTKKLEQKK